MEQSVYRVLFNMAVTNNIRKLAVLHNVISLVIAVHDAYNIMQLRYIAMCMMSC